MKPSVEKDWKALDVDIRHLISQYWWHLSVNEPELYEHIDEFYIYADTQNRIVIIMSRELSPWENPYRSSRSCASLDKSINDLLIGKYHKNRTKLIWAIHSSSVSGELIFRKPNFHEMANGLAEDERS